MNKNAVQRFAVWARTELIAQVSQRAYQYGVTAESCGEYEAEAVGGRLLTDAEKEQRKQLISQIRSRGYNQVMEEVAYTWFNRFIALRFMEVNNYLPTHVRIFSDASGAFKPEIMNDVLHLKLDGLDIDRVSELIGKNRSEDLYRYLLLTQCNALSGALPLMFEKMGGYTELLLPNNILRQDSILGRLVTDIPEEDWTDQVQIIGWLYQYYNTELKDDTFALLKKNVKITKDRIPSATQLFTPDWIVRYMVENSLGRLWLEGHPDGELKAGWKYYLDEAAQEPDVQKQLETLRAGYRALGPQDVKVIDPCMGSGHILVYAFDLLMQIYKKAGFSERDAAQSILENNLYGLDVDGRAAQLAYFAVMMKARQYDRRIFTRNIRPHLYSIVESGGVHISDWRRLGTERETAERLVAELKDAKEYGSILNLSVTMDGLAALRRRLTEIGGKSREGTLVDEMESAAIVEGLSPLVDIAETMVRKYDVVVTNPPYMGISNAGAKLAEFVKKNYPDSKADLFAVFIERCRQFTKKNGYQAMITQHSWMFLSSFEKLRTKLQTVDTVNMAHLGARAFEEIGGEVVQTTSFVLQNTHTDGYIGTYCRLIEPTTQQGKEDMFLAAENRYTAKQSNFSKIPGSPVAYWVSGKFFGAFEKGISIDSISNFTGSQNITSDNDRFLRFFWEVSTQDIGREKRWAFYAKGGEYRKWYGNITLVVDISRTAVEHYKNNSTSNYLNEKYWFSEGITYSAVTSKGTGFRYYPPIGGFDKGGATICYVKNLWYILALLNSEFAKCVFAMINPTINLQIKDVKALPVIFSKGEIETVELLSQKNVTLSRADWDSFETSWDFKRHPLVRGASTVQAAFAEWARECETRFQTLKANEEELNRIFIDIYGLQDELSPEVEERDVTVRRADLGRDVRSLVSYAVGCMFGRYSTDTPGLAYAGGEWDEGKYKSFMPDKDNIIPICDDDYFDDDIAGRFVMWLKAVFGKDTLEENLKFIAEALGGKGTPREAIRSYFLNDFYADHLKIYQKRPIYWLFDSGKKNGFKALVYMHRCRSDLLARLRTDYVHEQQERYRTQLKHIADALDSASAQERVKLARQQKKLQEQALELQKYEEKVHHLADRNIDIDLDDGVKHNYALFEDVLAKIK